MNGEKIVENRTPEEEMEYRRYLRRRIRMRKRKRKVRIIKALLALAAIVIAFFVFYLIGWLTGPIGIYYFLNFLYFHL